MTGKPPQQEPDEILEDLEDLHGFLEDESIPELNNPEPPGLPIQDDLPLLEEEVPVEPGNMPSSQGWDTDPNATDPTSRISDETIQTLLGDAWQESADELLANARQTIGDNSTLWQPEDTDELNRALKIRIDDTVRKWLGDVLKAHIHVLQQRIVTELAAELTSQINNKLNQDPGPADTTGDADQHT